MSSQKNSRTAGEIWRIVNKTLETMDEDNIIQYAERKMIEDLERCDDDMIDKIVKEQQEQDRLANKNLP